MMDFSNLTKHFLFAITCHAKFHVNILIILCTFCCLLQKKYVSYICMFYRLLISYVQLSIQSINLWMIKCMTSLSAGLQPAFVSKMLHPKVIACECVSWQMNIDKNINRALATQIWDQSYDSNKLRNKLLVQNCYFPPAFNNRGCVWKLSLKISD